ncbi:hypothetical protein ACJJTC_013565 [Scirpophaga incertulas]
MSLKKHLHYNIMEDFIEGYQDHAKQGRSPQIASYALVFYASWHKAKSETTNSSQFLSGFSTADRLAVLVKETTYRSYGSLRSASVTHGVLACPITSVVYLDLHPESTDLITSATSVDVQCCAQDLVFLRTDIERERRIHTVISEWILPRTSPQPLRPTSQASQATSQFTPRVSDSIILPDYVRAVETESHCFIEGCRRQERNRVPVTIRKMFVGSL